MKVKVALILTKGGRCLCGMTAEDTANCICLADGGGADLMDRLYRALQQVSWPTDNERRAGMMHTALSAAWPVPGMMARTDWSEATLAEAEEKAKRDRPQLSFRCDIGTGDFSVSAGSKLENMDLTIPGDMGEELKEAVLAYAKPIGFALGTQVKTWTREFREPWRKLSQCLKVEDPMRALKEGASGDVLALRPSIRTDRQMASEVMPYEVSCHRDLEEAYRAHRFIGVRVPGIFGLDTGTNIWFLEREGRNELFPTWGSTFRGAKMPEGSIRAQHGEAGRQGIADLLTELFLASEFGEELRILASVVYLAQGMEALFLEGMPEVQTLLAWYAKRLMLPYPDTEPVLSGGVFSLTWGELRQWLDDVCQAFLRPPVRNPIEVEEFLEAEGEKVQTMLEPSLHLQVYRALSGGLKGFGSRDWKAVAEKLEPLAGTAGLVGQAVYAVLPLSSLEIRTGVLERDRRGFCLAAPGEKWLPIADILDMDGRITFSEHGIEELAKEFGRRKVRFWTALNIGGVCGDLMKPSDFAALNRIQDLNSEGSYPIRELADRLTIPAGWTYIFAKFSDGAYGIAYGPMEDGESEDAAKRRLFQQAEKQPSENALILLDY